MRLIDSNILIYSYSSQFEYLREIILENNTYVSEISKLEVLGYHCLNQEEQIYFSDLFNYLPAIFPSQEIYDKAIEIRKKYKLKLGDSLIAGTALVLGLELFTRNVSDFEKIEYLRLVNPIK